MFVQTGTIKFAQTIIILWKMFRCPVQNHTDTGPVHLIHKIHKIFRRAITGSRRIISDGLIAKGHIQRMLHNRHQFDMGISHFFHIRNQLVCNFFIRWQFSSAFRFIIQITFHKAAQMYFIYTNGFVLILIFFPIFQPV